jgi:hypothetical protein
MKIRIVPYTEEHEEAVKAFNARLAAANLDKNLYSTRFAESHIPAWLPKRDGCDLYQEQFVAVDEQGAVHGGYILKHQPFLHYGEPIELADYRLPISEGIADRSYAAVGAMLYMDAMRRHPHLWGLGGGGYHIPNTQFLMRAGWRGTLVPFWFRIVNPNVFLSNIAFLRGSRSRRSALDFIRFSGIGWLGIKALHCVKGLYRAARLSCIKAPYFSEGADAVWHVCKNDYALIAVRDSRYLNIIYPPSNPRLIRLKIIRRGMIIGWAVLLDTQMNEHKQFGDMRVGTLVDCLAKPDDAPDVISFARDYLQAAGVDLIVTNQCAKMWCDALKRCGFLQGPSNFPFLASPKLAEMLEPMEQNSATFHLNRGDGDGPINL